MRSNAVYDADRRLLTCTDARKQVTRTSAPPVRDEETADRNLTTSTSDLQVDGYSRSCGLATPAE